MPEEEVHLVEEKIQAFKLGGKGEVFSLEKPGNIFT